MVESIIRIPVNSRIPKKQNSRISLIFSKLGENHQIHGIRGITKIPGKIPGFP
jgi:hypothetical protein